MFDVEQVRKKKDTIERLESRIDEFNIELDKIKNDFSSNSSKQKLLEGIPCGSAFPKCKFIRDAHVAVAKLPILENDMDEINNKINEYSHELQALEPERVNTHLVKYEQLLQKKVTTSTRSTEISLQIERNESAIKLAERDLEDLQGKLKAYEENKEAIENFQSLTKEKNKVEKLLKASQKSLNICEKERLQLYKQNGSLEQKLENIEKEYEEYKNLREDFSAYDLFMKCMHSNGIAFDIIKKKLPIINEEISKTISNIVDFEIFFEVDGNKFEIFIKHPKHDPRPLEMGSGAEKTIAAMAIRLALLTVSSIPKGDIFILDEPGTALDEENMEGFIRMLELIKMYFKTVLLISHLDSLKDCVDMQIEIDKKDGYAYVNQ